LNTLIMPLIECTTLFNETKRIASEELRFRPSVYGLVRNKGRILVIHSSATNKYEFPGGGIELGERMEDALRREMLEEAGVHVQIGAFVTFKENFFYHDLAKDAVHSFLFVYECTVTGEDVAKAHKDVTGREIEQPRWVEIAGLTEDDFGGTNRAFFSDFKARGLL
jgi:mutator protein MutT